MGLEFPLDELVAMQPWAVRALDHVIEEREAARERAQKDAEQKATGSGSRTARR